MGFLAWKFKRELQRVVQQLRSVPEFFTEPGQRRRHDATRSQWLIPLPGQAPLTPKLALLLIYQPSGVSASTRWTCEHLVGRGYAPLVISNAPLSDADKAMLLPVSWQVAERPNFGYDFGGYRDGIWLIESLGVEPDLLIIMNDSIWFPLQPDETLIASMEASSADFVGALQLDPLRQVEGVPAKKRPFFGSFFLMFKRGALKHPAFRTFWQNYRSTSNKYKTIRRGERGLSHTLMDAGLRCEAIYTRGALDAHIASLKNPALLRLLKHDLMTIDERIEVALQQCVDAYQDSAAWREHAIAMARLVTEKQNILATAPITSLSVFEVPYLKKSRDWANLKALRLIRERMHSGELPQAHASVKEEISRQLDTV